MLSSSSQNIGVEDPALDCTLAGGRFEKQVKLPNHLTCSKHPSHPPLQPRRPDKVACRLSAEEAWLPVAGFPRERQTFSSFKGVPLDHHFAIKLLIKI